MKSFIKVLCIASVGMLITTCGGGSSGPGKLPVVSDPPLVWDQGNWGEVEWQ